MSSTSFPVVHIFSKISLAILPEIVPSSILLMSWPSLFEETLDSLIFKFSLFNSADSYPMIQFALNFGEFDTFVTSSKNSAMSLSAANSSASY